MKAIFKMSILFLTLTLLTVPSSFGQDTKKKESAKKANSDEDGDDDDDMQKEKQDEENSAPEKTKKNINLNIAVEGGINLSSLIVSDNSGTTKAGLKFGGLLEFPLSPRFHIQPGIYYAMNGGSGVQFSDNVGSYRVEINTIEIPVNAIYKFGKTGKNHIFIGAGLCYGYNISGVINPGSTKLKIGSGESDQLEASNISFGLNAGYEMENGLLFRLNYLKGLSDLQPQASGSSVFSSSLGLQVGYYIARKKKE